MCCLFMVESRPPSAEPLVRYEAVLLCFQFVLCLSLFFFISFSLFPQTPICSGVISLLNDHQLQNGKPQLGPLNQWIYQNMKSFNDITKGANEGCDGQSGFPATLGWDGCTGVGSPLYARMVTALP